MNSSSHQYKCQFEKQRGKFFDAEGGQPKRKRLFSSARKPNVLDYNWYITHAVRKRIDVDLKPRAHTRSRILVIRETDRT